MSDNILKLIPVSPYYVPAEEAAKELIALVRQTFPLADNVEIEMTDLPQFIDQGENWEKVICPKCHSVIDPEWWQTAMDKAYEGGFVNLAVRVPCCGEDVSLNDLEYYWPAGFARFSIEIHNPKIEVSDTVLNKFEAIIGSSLRKIWAHY